jgi:hypothetical protein
VALPVGLPGEGDGRPLQEVTLRKLTGREEALMADPRLRRNAGKLVTALLASCATGADDGRELDAGRVRGLCSADRSYLLLQLRRLTFGDHMEARYTCPRCRQVTLVTEDVAELDARPAGAGVADGEIRVTLQDGYQDPDGAWQHELVFRLPTGEDEEAAGARADGNPARQRDVLLARCLVRVGELELRQVRALGPRVLADLSMADRRHVQHALDDQTPGPDLTRTVVCDHCGEEYRTTLDMSHFFPTE